MAYINVISRVSCIGPVRLKPPTKYRAALISPTMTVTTALGEVS
jgi:hypothetical protein